METRRDDIGSVGPAPASSKERDGSPAQRCAFCRRAMPERSNVGRPRRYCRRSCRQRAFERRRRTTELSWGDERTAQLTERLALQGDRLAHVSDVVSELRMDLADGVDLTLPEVLARIESATEQQ